MTGTATDLDVQELEVADAATLRRLWTDIRGSEPPRTFTARLMRLSLAWEAQAAAYGGETAQVRRAWKQVIRARPELSANSSGEGERSRTICQGTRILKDWGGVTHEVPVTEGGATWNGQSYTSLSAVARAMTGNNRNGPKFFGLREKGRP